MSVKIDSIIQVYIYISISDNYYVHVNGWRLIQNFVYSWHNNYELICKVFTA